VSSGRAGSLKEIGWDEEVPSSGGQLPKADSLRAADETKPIRRIAPGGQATRGTERTDWRPARKIL